MVYSYIAYSKNGFTDENIGLISLILLIEIEVALYPISLWNTYLQ